MRKQTKIAALVSAAALLTIGAAMTSFAAKWDIQDGQWVYLDSDGERVEYEWKKSGADWYYLGEGGYMATDQLIDDDDNGDIYYVGADGRRVINDWRSVPNDEGEEVSGDVVDTIWYYFGSTGKAYRAKEDDLNEVVKKTVPWSGGSNVFFFDTNGYMQHGWITDYYANDANATAKKGDIYYLGDESEGWARAKGAQGSNGWQYLEVPDDWSGPNGDAYEDEEWFYFQTSGKAYKADPGTVNVTKYIDNLYFTFDENGVLRSKWYDYASSATTPVAYTGVDGVKNGWVYTTTKDDDDTSEWFYLVTVGKNKTVAYGSGATDKDFYARSINGKTYLFNGLGVMQDDVITLGGDNKYHDTWDEKKSGINLTDGTYYFSDAAASQGKDGRLLTGKQSYTKDGETSYYYFRKADEKVGSKTYSKGSAITQQTKDGYLYGDDGKRINAEDGNGNDLVTIGTDVGADEDGVYGGVYIDDLKKTYKDGTMIVSSNGKVKKSGTVTIDGTVYKVANYLVQYSYERGDSTNKAGGYLDGSGDGKVIPLPTK